MHRPERNRKTCDRMKNGTRAGNQFGILLRRENSFHLAIFFPRRIHAAENDGRKSDHDKCHDAASGPTDPPVSHRARETKSSADGRTPRCRYWAPKTRMFRPNRTRRAFPPQTTNCRFAAASGRKTCRSQTRSARPVCLPLRFRGEGRRTRRTASWPRAKTIPEASVNCAYPRKRNSSKKPTQRNTNPQSAA